MYKSILYKCKYCTKEINLIINTQKPSNVVFCNNCMNKIGSVAELIKLDDTAQKKREVEHLALVQAQKLEYEEKQKRLKAQKLKNYEDFLNSIPNNFQLLHFTDIRNLESIQQNGLLSWENLEKDPFNYLRERDYFPASDPPGSHNHKNGLSRHLDELKGYTNYVRLCKNSNHEMIEAAKKRGNNLCLLTIKIEALFDLKCLFSDDNATALSRSVEINTNYKTFINSNKNQAEVLVENCVPIEYIEQKWIKI